MFCVQLTWVVSTAERNWLLKPVLHLDGHLVGALAAKGFANGAISHLKHALVIAVKSTDGLARPALFLWER
jgi:hypothetical protein